MVGPRSPEPEEGTHSLPAASQQAERIVRLAGDAVHDLNNILTAIMGHSELLRSQLAPADPARAHLDEIDRAVARAAALTARVREVLEAPPGR